MLSTIRPAVSSAIAQDHVLAARSQIEEIKYKIIQAMPLDDDIKIRTITNKEMWTEFVDCYFSNSENEDSENIGFDIFAPKNIPAAFLGWASANGDLINHARSLYVQIQTYVTLENPNFEDLFFNWEPKNE